MEKLKLNAGCEELNAQEEMGINGGESFLYWGFYIFGSGVRFVQGAIENPPNLPSATVYK